MINRFQTKFMSEVAKLGLEHGFLITEDGYIEPILDWFDSNQVFHYTLKEDAIGVKINGVESGV